MGNVNGRPESNLNTSGPHTGPFYNVHGLHVDENGNAAFDDGSVHLRISRRMDAGREVADRIFARNADRPMRKVINAMNHESRNTRNSTPEQRRYTQQHTGHSTANGRRKAAGRFTTGVTAGTRIMSDNVKTWRSR